MKGYIHRYFALLTLVGAWAFTGCTDDVESLTAEGAGCFNLVVTVPDEAATRATDAELANNEFKVTKLHLYFYKIAGHDDATSPSVYDYAWDGEDFNTTNTLTVPLPADALTPEGLFGGRATDTQCKVYAVANVDEKSLTVENPTIDQLKATAVTNTFDQTKVQPSSFAMDGQAEVTIDRTTRKATGEITLERAAAKITLAIKVDAIEVTPAGGNENDAVTYTPNTEAMHVWISNGVKNSKLNTDPDDASFTVPAGDLYSNEIKSDDIGSGFTYTEAMETYKYVQNVPFYSYPNKWEKNRPEGNCYLTLVLPWKYGENNDKQVTTYYRIPVQPEACKVERNMHYDIRVTIARLGSTEQTPIDVTVDWNYALEWNNHALVTDIKEIRYLLLNQNYYDGSTGAYTFEMNNTTEIEIPVGTSHETIIAEVKMSWYDYRVNPPVKREIELTPTSDGSTNYKYSNLSDYNKSVYAGIEMDNATSKLYLKRELLHIRSGVWVEGYTDNNGTWTTEDDKWVEGHWEDGGFTITEKAALNTYTFDIVLQHKYDENRKANVRIIQYPSIYIEAQESAEETRFVNNNYSEDHIEQKASATNPPIYGYVNIIGKNYPDPNVHKDSRPDNAQVLDNDYNWDYYLGCLEPYYLNSTINNPYTYIINISKFSNIDGDYIVADPRERSVNNFPMNRDTRVKNKRENDDPASWSVPDANNKVLSYYYPTSTDPNKTRYIAPAYRVASQWGMTQTTTYEGGKRRCAAYQENGRPAGRWRLPTIAEIEYIARLSNEGYIPYLFGSSTTTPTYICGSGYITVDNTVPKVTIPEKPQTEGFIRCVYDEWYWGNDTLTVKNQFTWGDRERSISGN